MGLSMLAKTQSFAVARLFATRNNTFVHVTDLSGRETIARATGGIIKNRGNKKTTAKKGSGKSKRGGRLKPEPNTAIAVARVVEQKCKELGITALHIKIRATGGIGTKTPGPGARHALRTLARSGLKIGRIEDSTPTPSDSTRHKGGRRGRRT